MKKSLLPTVLISFVLGFLLAVLLGRIGTLDIIDVSTSMTFSNAAAPTIAAFDLEVESGEVVQWAGVGAGAVSSEPTNLSALPDTFAWKFAAPTAGMEYKAHFAQRTIPTQDSAMGYALVMIASIKKTTVFGSNKSIRTRIYWFAKDDVLGGDPTKTHPIGEAGYEPIQP